MAAVNTPPPISRAGQVDTVTLPTFAENSGVFKRDGRAFSFVMDMLLLIVFRQRRPPKARRGCTDAPGAEKY